MSKIKIDKDLYEKIRKISETAGYSSVNEFVSHLLENVVSRSESEEHDEDILKRLQGLGYIN